MTTIEERVLNEYDICKTYKENLRMYQGRHGHIGQCVYFGILRSHGITRKVTDRKRRREKLKASVKNAYNPNASVESNMARLTELTGFRFVSPERYKNKLLKSLGTSDTSPYSHEKHSDDTLVLPRRLSPAESLFDAKTSIRTCNTPKQANTLAPFHTHIKQKQRQ